MKAKIFHIILLMFLLIIPLSLSAKNFEIKNDTNTFLFVNGTTGNVGIGMTTTNATFEVFKTGAVSPEVFGVPTLVKFSSPSGTIPWALRQNADSSATPNLLWFETSEGWFGSINAMDNNTFGMKAGTGMKLAFGADARYGASSDLLIDTSGYVGIGTTAPNQKLQVNGSVNATTYYGVGTGLTGTAASLTVGVSNDLSCTDCIGSTEISDEYLLNTGDTASGNYTFDSTTLHIDSTNDRVGIGTNSPGLKLDISTNSTSFDGIAIANSNSAGSGTVYIENNLATQGFFRTYGSTFALPYLADSAAFGSTKDINIFTDASSASGGTHAINFFTSGYNQNLIRMTIASTGNVGIGTASPTAVLHINGTNALLNIQNTTGSTILYVNGTGYVGIGTTSPFSKFQVGASTGASTISLSNITNIFGAYSTLGRATLSLYTTDASTDNYGGTIAFGGETGQAVSPYIFGEIIGAKEPGGTYQGYLGFRTTPVGTDITTERMRITSTGSVGIGTTSPSQKLDVNGSINMSVSSGGNLSSAGNMTLFASGGSVIIKLG